MKKIYAAMICIMMALLFVTPASAEDEGTLLEVATVTAEAGADVEVPLTVTGNTGLCGATLSVSYDQKLTLTDVKAGEAFSMLQMTKPGDMSANPVRILWFGNDADDSNGVICTLVFSAPEEAGTYAIVITYEPDDVVDDNLDPVELTIVNGSITVEDNKTDQEIADEFIAALDEMDAADRKAVEKMRMLFNNLTEEQKALIPEETLKKLTDAEEVFRLEDEKKQEDQQAAAEVENTINSMDPEDAASVQAARDAYDSLTDDQKALVKAETLEKLTAAEKALEDARLDQEAADAVIALINGLASPENLTAEDEEALEAVRDAYDDLTEKQKELIGADILAKLEAAEAAIEALVADVWGAWTVEVEATCETSGTEVRTNLQDPTVQQRREISALGHDWDDGVVTQEPGCDTEGNMTYTCRNDETHTYTETLPALGHNLTYMRQITADCENPGNYAYWHCENCGKNFGNETGTEEVSEDKIRIPALQHRLSEVEYKAPECETDGNLSYYHCTFCGKDFLNADGTEELSAEDIVLPAYGHFWDNGVITKKPTEAENGEKTYTCEECGETKTEPITYDEVVIGDHAWADCEFLEEFWIGADICKIGDEAFAGCTNLKDIYFDGDMPEFGVDVFKNIAKDAVIYYPKDNPTWSDEKLQEAGVSVQTALWDPVTMEIVQNDVTECTIIIEAADLIYDGKQKKPAVSVRDGQRQLEENKDYTLVYGSNVDAGIGTVDITGRVNYKGTIQKSFLIAKAEGRIAFEESTKTCKVGDAGFDLTLSELISDGTVTYTSSNSEVATVDSKTGHVEILAEGTTLITASVSGTNYTTVSAVIALTVEKGSQSQDEVKTKKANKITASSLTIKGTGAVQKKTLQASALGGAGLSYKSDTADVKVSKNGVLTIASTFAGRAKVTITSAETDDYLKASKTVSVTVLPKAMSISKVTSTGSRKVQVTWKRNKTAQGYEIQYATNKSFTKGLKKITVGKQKTVKKTIKKLTGGKRYYFRIRSYVKINGKKYYSSWSKVKKVKVKK